MTPLITSVCYVRLDVQIHAASRFAADMFGLQRIASPDWEVSFRSDHRFRTVSFSEGPKDGGRIDIEVWSEPGNTSRPARQFPLTTESLCSWGSESKDVPELQAG